MKYNNSRCVNFSVELYSKLMKVASIHNMTTVEYIYYVLEEAVDEYFGPRPTFSSTKKDNS